ncbi:hypothetical protein [Streptomyces seoulensis]|uniref:hypothetical protein n=1 Tax=Streptomyces seoulensis TaxID=73044 RepID=UPI00103CF32C|nr:hypothetical protein [Streptomyces seoulensis]
MSVVHFPEYRAYEQDRIKASDAMMALLAGSRLAENTLRLTDGSSRFLPEIFPAVPHIQRMNLTTANARTLLADAEQHLSAMAVPYALAIHEDFVQTCFGLLIKAGLTTRGEVAGTNASSMHRLFEQKAGQQLPREPLEQFHLIRQMRNAVIHAGGKPKQGLVTAANNLSPNALADWIKVAGEHPSARVTLGVPVTFSHGELILALAVTKRISQKMNFALRDRLPREIWTDCALIDFTAEHPNLNHLSQRKRKLTGFLRTYYQPLNLTEAEIASGIQRAGW